MIKTYRVFILSLIFLIFFSCKKQEVYYTGIVYSKHHFPMQNLSVNFGFNKGNDKERAGYYEVTTDGNGRFILQKKIPTNLHVKSISIHSDSGYYIDDVRNNLEITLQ